MGGNHVKNMDAGGWSEGLRHSFCKAPPSPTGRFLKDLRGQWTRVQWTKHEDQNQIEIGEYANLTKKTSCSSGNQYRIVWGFEPHEWDMSVNQHAGTTNRIGMAKGHGYVCIYTYIRISYPTIHGDLINNHVITPAKTELARKVDKGM
jgi:hypothetical protein